MADISQDLLAQFNQLQQQLQLILMQKENTSLQIQELKFALKEVEKAKGSVYKTAGSILIEMTPEEAKKDIEMELESLELRMKALEKQEQTTKDKLIEMRNKIYGKGTNSEKKGGVAK